MPFVAGAHVFPGGAVDPADATLLPGAPEGIGEDLAFRVAAIRECFEESGVLLASRSDGQSFPACDSGLKARLAEHRHHLLRGRIAFARVLGSEGLVPAVGRLQDLSRWITPEGLPRRYDTRFFLALAPEAQPPSACGRETLDARWYRPAEALAAHARGDIELVLPTRRTLEVLTDASDTRAVLTAVREVGD